MKRLVLFLSVSILLLSITTQCRKSDPSCAQLWGIRTPHVDSLTNEIERRFYAYAATDTTLKLIEELDSIAKRTDDTDLKRRARFLKGMTYVRMGYGGSGDEIFEELIQETDSVSNPYLYNRILQMQNDYSDCTIKDYNTLTSLLKYFTSKKDVMTSATLYMELGCLLKNLSDPNGAIQALDMADSLFRKGGFPDIAIKDSINRASVYFVLEDTVRGAAILNRMLTNPLVTSDPQVEGVVLHNLFGYANDTTAIRRLAAMEETPTSTSLTYMAKEALGRGDTREAMSLVRKGLDAALEEEDADGYAIGLYTIARVFAATGQIDSAYQYLDEAVELNNEIVDTRNPMQARALETARIIAHEKMEAELKSSRRVVWLSISFSAILILLLVVAFVLRARVQKMKIEKLRATLDREKMERRLLAANILIDEKNAVIQAANNSSSVKSYQAQAPGRESFVEVFSELHPSFPGRLRSTYPSLTDADIRLASYICVGLDNKQIAATLGIRHESVKQARWRLRSKMGLNPGESLERKIATFASVD